VFLDANHNVLLGDFGLSTEFDPATRSIVAFAGTLHYAPPEAFLESMVFGPELDVWSAGAVLYVMLRGRYPFWGDTDNEAAKAILLVEAFWPEWFTADAIDLLRRIFNKDPRKRATIDDIKRHPFIRDQIRHWSQHATSTVAAGDTPQTRATRATLKDTATPVFLKNLLPAMRLNSIATTRHPPCARSYGSVPRVCKSIDSVASLPSNPSITWACR
jgi:serine/threonine protein kinase